MMAAYAAEAMRQAREEYGQAMDFEHKAGREGAATSPAEGLPTSERVARLERILDCGGDRGGDRVCPGPANLDKKESEWLTLLWGACFGELLRQEFGGEWVMSVYPGSEFSVPTLEVRGSRLYPLLKVNRRLTMGAGEALPGFYAMIAARLSSVNPS